MIKDNLLIELGTEELPPKALKKLALSFKDGIEQSIKNADLTFESTEWFAAPRRLAVRINQLESQQQDKVVEKRGPAISAAFDADGNPTKAAQGWSRGCGIDISEAERLKTDKGEWLLHKATVKGQELSDLVEDFIKDSIKGLPIPKPMRWGNKSEEFIRPVHTLIVMYGDNVLPAQVLGLSSSNLSQGHSFHHRGLVEVSSALNYEKDLQSAHVVVNYETRRSMIVEQLEAICKNEAASTPSDSDLLDEVCSLVEWPVALIGTFEERFLEVPAEALMYTMKDDQKYFPLLDENGKLLPKFVFVSNIESKDPTQVIAGNEKVIRPRLSDAEFFYNTDKKQTLESRLTSLESVLFQKDLGTLKDKSERISDLAKFIATKIGANEELSARAGLLSKTDLMTEVVMEFTDVQGVMGKYYALNDGENPVVADALYQQYLPRFAGDVLPSSLEACAVALADKFDTLVGIFGIGQHPKGVKDPFALRRAAIGSIRIMVEKQLNLDFKEVATFAKGLFGSKLTNQNVVSDVVEFILGRFQSHYQEQGIQVEMIRAVEAKSPTSALDFDQRLNAVLAFAKLDAASSLAAANKRVNNILAKNKMSEFQSINVDLLVSSEETALYEKIKQVQPGVDKAYQDGNYQHGLEQLASLKDEIDGFFDNVMVMDENIEIRDNRLAILGTLQKMFMHTADISVL